MDEYLKKKKIAKIKIVVIQLIIVSMFIVIWELFAKTKLIDSFLFSSPSKIFKTFSLYLANGELFRHIGVSLLETFIGLFLGTLIGFIIAIVLWYFPFVEKVLSPFLVVFNALPKTALAPVVIIWVGTNIKGIIVVAVTIFVIMTIISFLTGFKQVEEDKIKMLQSFNASRFQVLVKLIIPANVVNILSVIKINIGLAWVGVIVGEFLVSKAGIGYLIMYGTQVFKMDVVMMGVVTLAILSFLMYGIFCIFEKKLARKRG